MKKKKNLNQKSKLKLQKMKFEIFFLAIFVSATSAAQNEPVDFSNVLKVKKNT